tara:strand:- start:780 stop:941 length:162 start_codon:yes stop_codon:yes gene_type:complete
VNAEIDQKRIINLPDSKISKHFATSSAEPFQEEVPVQETRKIEYKLQPVKKGK